MTDDVNMKRCFSPSKINKSNNWDKKWPCATPNNNIANNRSVVNYFMNTPLISLWYDLRNSNDTRSSIFVVWGNEQKLFNFVLYHDSDVVMFFAVSSPKTQVRTGNSWEQIIKIGRVNNVLWRWDLIVSLYKREETKRCLLFRDHNINKWYIVFLYRANLY